MICRPITRTVIAVLVLLAGPLVLRAAEAPNLEDLERRIEAAKQAEADKAEAERRASAQRADAERRKAAEAATKATLVLRSDAPCRLTLDGEAAGELAAGTLRNVAVAPGQQLLACVSMEQESVKYEEVITAQAGAKTVHEIKLAQRVAEVRSAAQAKAAKEAKERSLCANPAGNPVCLEDAGGGVLRQPATGLEWTQANNGQAFEWKGAKRYCEGKGSGWRLPSVDELSGIYDESDVLHTACGSVTCDVSPLFKLTRGYFWSGDKSGSSEAWSVDLFFGHRHAPFVSIEADPRALCVRRS